MATVACEAVLRKLGRTVYTMQFAQGVVPPTKRTVKGWARNFLKLNGEQVDCHTLFGRFRVIVPSKTQRKHGWNKFLAKLEQWDI